MNIVVRIKLSCNLKNSSSAVGYYSYTNRCQQYAKYKFTNREDTFFPNQEVPVISS